MSGQLSPPFSASASPLRANRPSSATPSKSSISKAHDPLEHYSPRSRSTYTLPSAYRDGNNNLIRLSSDPAPFIEQDLSVTRLNEMHKHLWLAGRPTGARPLHRQKMIDRSIIITEQAHFHLIWHESRIFLKPLPEYLLSYNLWVESICPNPSLHASASGFLLSYIWLIGYPSDLEVAISNSLIPSSITWEQWTTFTTSVLSNLDYEGLGGINKRYRYGELRLNRLNIIYRLTHIFDMEHFMRGYMYGYNRYTVFFERNFGWLLLVFLYMTLVLTAMQVGLGTTQLQNNGSFHRASYGFAVFSIVLPVSVVGLTGILFVWFVLANLLATRAFLYKQRRRLRRAAVGIEAKG